ncbi:MAG: hypothetical protein ACK4QW_08815 [Alphaproteobacteria bacterium]
MSAELASVMLLTGFLVICGVFAVLGLMAAAFDRTSLRMAGGTTRAGGARKGAGSAHA